MQFRAGGCHTWVLTVNSKFKSSPCDLKCRLDTTIEILGGFDRVPSVVKLVESKRYNGLIRRVHGPNRISGDVMASETGFE